MLSSLSKKLGSLGAIFVLSFVPYCRVIVNVIVEYVVSSISKSNGTFVGKDASYYPLCFSRENIKEAMSSFSLSTVADLTPVTLICNHEVKATKLYHTYHIHFFYFAT